MRALATEGQDRRRLLSGYLDRPLEGGVSCVLLTDGKRLTGTFTLRAWSPSMLLTLADDNTDLRRLRERYLIFRRSLGLPLTPPAPPVATPTPPPPRGWYHHAPGARAREPHLLKRHTLHSSSQELHAFDVPLNQAFRRLLHLPPSHPNAHFLKINQDKKKIEMICRIHFINV